jgi:hypothetical protein
VTDAGEGKSFALLPYTRLPAPVHHLGIGAGHLKRRAAAEVHGQRVAVGGRIGAAVIRLCHHGDERLDLVRRAGRRGPKRDVPHVLHAVRPRRKGNAGLPRDLAVLRGVDDVAGDDRLSAIAISDDGAGDTPVRVLQDARGMAVEDEPDAGVEAVLIQHVFDVHGRRRRRGNGTLRKYPPG